MTTQERESSARLEAGISEPEARTEAGRGTPPRATRPGTRRRARWAALSLAAAGGAGILVFAAPINAPPTTFAASTPIKAGEVNDNFATLYNNDASLNGQLFWSSATGGIGYSSGNVGIGTASPGPKIEVSTIAQFPLKLVGSDTWQTAFALQNTTSADALWSFCVGGSGNNASAAGVGGLGILGGSSPQQFRLTIGPNGNIGIGTGAPVNHRLHLAGGGLFVNPTNATPEGHAVGGIMIAHGGSSFPNRALQVFPATANNSSYILHGGRDATNTYWWSYGVTADGRFAIGKSTDLSIGNIIISQAGYVGIGMNPTNALSVGSATDAVRAQVTGASSALLLGGAGATTGDSAIVYDRSGGNLHFQTGTNGGTYTSRLIINGNNGNVAVCNLTANGPVYSSGTVLTNTNPSSRDYKRDIAPVELDPMRLLRLEPKSFVWKSDGRADVGLVAEEVREVMPELYRDDGQTVGYDIAKLPLYLIELAKLQQARIEELEARLAALEGRTP